MSSIQVCENDAKIWALQAKNQSCTFTSNWEMLQYSRSGLMLEVLRGKGAYRCGWRLGYLRAISIEAKKHSHRAMQRACKMQTNLNNKNGFNAVWIFQGAKGAGRQDRREEFFQLAMLLRPSDLSFGKYCASFLPNLSTFQTILAKLSSWVVKGLGRDRLGHSEGCLGRLL